MWAREAVQGLEPGSPAEAGAGRDRQSDRDLTLGWVREYESAVCKVKEEIPVNRISEILELYQTQSRSWIIQLRGSFLPQ